jgi:HSP20 family protein
MSVETESIRFLAPENPTLSPGDAFFELSQEFNERISRRAYELFELRVSVDGHDREDWLQAQSEILLSVPADITETETGLTVRAVVPGYAEKELEVRVAPRSVCITGAREEETELKQEDVVNVERRSSRIFRMVELPGEVDPGKVSASLSYGILEISLEKVGLGKKVPVVGKAASA